jgi:hypothetical protein
MCICTLLDFSIFSSIGHASDLAFKSISYISIIRPHLISQLALSSRDFDIPKNSRKLRYRSEKSEGLSHQELTISRHNDEMHFTHEHTSHSSFESQLWQFNCEMRQRKDGRNMLEATWEPYEKHGRLTMQSDLPDSVYAFPKQRKEPLTDARHVRNAVARFDQVIDVSDDDRALAFANIEKAAKYYNLNLSETSWHDLGVHPQLNRKEAAAKGVVTRERERREQV